MGTKVLEDFVRGYIRWACPEVMAIEFSPRTFDPDTASIFQPRLDWITFTARLGDGSSRRVKFLRKDWETGDIFKYFGENNLIWKSLNEKK